MNIEELKEKYPELWKQIEDEKAALTAEVETLKTKVTDLEAKIAEGDKDEGEKVKTLESEVTELKQWKDEALAGFRTLIKSVSEIEGVLPEGEPQIDPTGEANEALEKELADVKKELTDAKEKITTLENAEKTREDEKKSSAEEAKLQADLKVKLDELLAKDEYKVYAGLLREDLVGEDEKIKIESVEKAEEAVKNAFERINKIRTANIKAKITENIEDVGKIENPEGDGDEGALKERLTSLYQESVSGGFKGTFDEWKEKYPQIVKMASE